MKINYFQADNFIPRPIEQVFGFFSNAENLGRVTPPHLEFEILTSLPITMKEGTLIDYRLRIHRVPVYWQTEITVWEPPHRFVDVQRTGPYKKWMHEHRFQSVESGTHMSDQVEYAVPGGWFAGLVNYLFVRRDIEKIFAYRKDKFSEFFPPELPKAHNNKG